MVVMTTAAAAAASGLSWRRVRPLIIDSPACACTSAVNCRVITEMSGREAVPGTALTVVQSKSSQLFLSGKRRGFGR